MNIIKSIKKFGLGATFIFASGFAAAEIPANVSKAITDGFSDAQTVAFLILSGLAVIYGITISKRLLR